MDRVHTEGSGKIRDLARRVAQIAHDDDQAKIRDLWARHNNLENR